MQRMMPEYDLEGPERPSKDCPANYVPWYKAAQYCRWLSEREGVPESEMCYPPIDQIKGDITLPENYLERSGYRLPTVAEWEYASRSGSTTIRFFGSPLELLPKYAWYVRNSDEHTWPVGTLIPNDFGLFDVYGNVLEWCQDAFVEDKYQARAATALSRFVRKTDDRMLKGGSFGHMGAQTQSADRSWMSPDIQTARSGFRIARTIH
jgi:formylglycine-generating enzyme required for sulfatase activity